MKIDTHTHIWHCLLFSRKGKRYVPDYLFFQKDLEAQMQKHGVDKAVLVQPSFLEHDNSLIIETIKKNPRKFKGVIVLDNFDSYSNLKSILYDYDKVGIKGIRFNLIGKNLPKLSEQKYLELFSILNELDWHLEIHADEDDICTLFKNFKDKNLKIVFDHFARPLKEKYSNEFIEVLNSGLNLYIKLSANYRFNDYKIDNYLNILFETIGKDKLLWGSDCPFTRFEKVWNYQKSIDLLIKNKLAYNLEETLDNNAKKLFGWR